MSNWTLFSNHGHVLVCLARDPETRLRDVAAAVGITERAVQKIVSDLQESGMISVSKKGRRNQYRIHRKAGLRHELEAGSTVGGMIDFVTGKRQPVVKQAAVEKTQVADKPVADKPMADKPTESDPTDREKTGKEEHKDAADAGSKVKQKKVTKASEAKSDVEKQQGSLF